MTEPVYPDPFHPVLLTSSPVTLSDEQIRAIDGCIDVACSDAQFAIKLKAALRYILSSGPIIPSFLSELIPSSVKIGSPSFTLHVWGEDFTPNSVINFAGVDELTVFISENELTTEVNMPLWVGPDSVPVLVKNQNGQPSNVLNFVFEAASPVILSLIPSSAVVGGPDFTLRITGSGFNALSMARINGVDAVTSYVSATELDVPIDMGLVLNPVVAPITVANGSDVSNSMDFTVTL